MSSSFSTARLENQHALRGGFGSSVTFNSQTGNFENLRTIRSTASGIKLPMPSSRYILERSSFIDKDPLVRQWPRSRILTITGYILWWKRKRPWGCRDRMRSRSELKSDLAGKGWLRQGDYEPRVGRLSSPLIFRLSPLLGLHLTQDGCLEQSDRRFGEC